MKPCKRGHRRPTPADPRGCRVCNRARDLSRKSGRTYAEALRLAEAGAIVRWPGNGNGQFGKSKPGLEAKRTPTVADIAWAAGIFEGEGSVASVGGARAYVGQKDRWILERLRDLFGGTISLARNQKYAAEYWSWHISGTRARGFLMTIFGFLSPRRKEQAIRLWKEAA